MNFFKRKIVKLKIYFKKKLNNKDISLTEHEKICFEIFRKYLYNHHSKLLMSPEITDPSNPNSYKRYICFGEIENPDVAIVITYSNIKIINHTYVYTIDISKPLYLKMISMFDRKIIKERNIMESAIYKNITDGLSKLANE